MNKLETFFNLHQQDKPLILPNAWDAASARIIEDQGALAIATTSAGVAWGLGHRDGHILPVSLLAQVAQSITRVIKIPLSIDFENGYSDNAKVVAENIKALLDAGIVGINLEDGRDSPDVLSAKISAIKSVVESRGSRLFINARTDVYLAGLVPAEEAVNEVIKRAKLYKDAGADGLFVPVITDEGEIAQIAQNVSLPLNVMAMPGLGNADELGALGVKRLSAGAWITQIAFQTTAKLAKAFLTEGDSAVFEEDAMSGAMLQELFADK
ncbi:isocitrate lyase/phosphoenolpyruvate mutase family protein [Mucilaginibacter sp. SG564]|uniref:isocitrate lyase/PEP mutase family protein n=1 Tax=Mucilaginibacter sp. SG564 TaxID=2587022 RepID=UPI00155445BA|nr:isocitrate lyase/phosphoenolpyruvate mutase family protein [Mucilaginibacter sp. SG564]NOW96074.1 2-methylisocitrate lyase-like PEP mutase family enzyme [Mucilaginibacter sp. SG564]